MSMRVERSSQQQLSRRPGLRLAISFAWASSLSQRLGCMESHWFQSQQTVTQKQWLF